MIAQYCYTILLSPLNLTIVTDYEQTLVAVAAEREIGFRVSYAASIQPCLRIAIE